MELSQKARYAMTGRDMAQAAVSNGGGMNMYYHFFTFVILGIVIAWLTS